MSHKLSVVIPCYNESENIPHILERLNSVLSVRRDVEFVLVDNGSTDNSSEIFAKLVDSAKNPQIQVVKVEKNEGYGHGILIGLKSATGSVLAWTHADMQTDPMDVVTAYLEYLKRESPLVFVKGKRRNRRWLETFFTWGMQVFANFALGTKLDDINAQPKLFSREFYAKFLENKAPKDFSLDLFALYQARRHCNEIVEIPVLFKKRLGGEAKGGGSWKTRIKLIRRTFAYIWELRKNLRYSGACY